MPTNRYQPLIDPYRLPGTEKRRWSQFSLWTMLAVVAGIAVIVAIAAAVAKKLSPPPAPPLGLPRVSDIARMQAHLEDVPGIPHTQFDVPSEHWDDVRTALSSATYDRSPAAWVTYGTLDLTNRDETKFHVTLYSSGDGGLAISAGETHEKRVYYRGGDKALLFRTLKDAYEDAKAPPKP